MSELETDLVLKLKSSDRYLTREELSEALGVGFQEIRAAIDDLGERGYRIDNVPGHGYRLLTTPSELDGSDIRSDLQTSILAKEVLTFGRVTSTNDVAAVLAKAGACEGTLVIAEEQSKGRGRMGRGWHSPPGSGLWFSIVLRPGFDAAYSSTVSLAVALGVAQALERDYGIRTRIKWPNDVLADGRKICGILTEAEFTGNTVNYVIVGVGLNVLTQEDEFPRELRNIATSLRLETGEEVSRTGVLSRVMEAIEEKYLRLCREGFGSLRSELLGRSALIGKMIRLVVGGGAVEGMATDIDQWGALIIRKENGSSERIIAGDVINIM